MDFVRPDAQDLCVLVPDSPFPLVGREAELRRLSPYVAELVSGRGRAVLVEGEPGVGKSALIKAVCEDARQQGCQVLWGAADELGQTFALLPLIEAVGAAEPGWRTELQRIVRGGSQPPTAGSDAVLAATEWILATIDELCGSSPVVLVIDDLQWADSATIMLWSRLARSVHQLPLLLLGAARGVPRRDDLVALHALVRRGDIIRLGGLSEPAVSELIALVCGGRPGAGLRRLAAGAAGNSLYLGELLAALRNNDALVRGEDDLVDVADVAVPATLGEAIGDRLRFLTTAAREVLGAAALLGVEFSVADLSVVSGRPVAELVPALRDARAAGILIDAQDVLAFRHPLIRAALYDELPAPIRTAWHRDAARALAETGAAPERVVRQLLAAVDLDPASPGQPIESWMLDWLVTSAPMLTSQAPAASIALLRRSVQAITSDDPRRSVLACRLAEALQWTGNLDQAEQVAARELPRARDPELVVAFYETLTYCQSRAGRHGEALEVLARATATPGLTQRHLTRLEILTARLCVAQGRLVAAEEAAAGALARADPDDHWSTGWALMTLADVRSMRGLPGSLELFEQALAATEDDPALTGLRLLTMANEADELFNQDRLEDAERIAQQLRQMAESSGNVLRVAQAQGILGVLLFYDGRWDDALAEIDAPLGPHFFSHEAYLRGVAANIALHRARPGTARTHLAVADAHVERVGGSAVSLHFLARILELEHAGDPRRAVELISGMLARPDDDIGNLESWLADAVRLALAIGDTATAQAVTERAAEINDLGAVTHRRAVALHCRGQFDADPDLLNEAAQAYRQAGWVLPRVQAIEAAALLFARRGDLGPARASGTEALEVYAGLGAAWDLARLRANLRTAGIRQGPSGPRRRPTHGWDSLTPTEVRIADLVGEGLSNPKIAERLFLSRRTVQTHVSHLLTKLELRSRVDIALQSARRGSGPG